MVPRFGSCLSALALPCCLALGAMTGAPALAQQVVPGPWGAVVDPVKPQVFATAAERTVYYRRLQMNAMSSHFRSLEAVFAYGVPFGERNRIHADALVTISTGLDGLFSEGTAMQPGTWGARPAIWSEPERFSRHVAGLQAAAGELRDAFSGADRSRDEPAMTAVRHQCLACHERFREFRTGTR